MTIPPRRLNIFKVAIGRWVGSWQGGKGHVNAREMGLMSYDFNYQHKQ